jgi:predicted membrane-bound dolichyl-phosphate-mannose-protein mannosyltransferase
MLSTVKKILPYFSIAVLFITLIFWKYPEIFRYQFSQNTVQDYLRSQDIEDPKGLIKDRIIMSDSDTYAATGYLYAKGEDPTKYNFQHPPLIKYLFGFSTVLTGNPYYIQIVFGLALLFLTYFLGTKVFTLRLRSGPWIALIPVGLLLIDPLFGSMMTEILLDLGQATFALGYVILALFFPESYIFQGVILGLFAASKFWSTAIVIVGLLIFHRLFVKKGRTLSKGMVLSFVVAFGVFSLTYIVSLTHGLNIFFFLAKQLKYILAHDSAGAFGGTIILFLKTNIVWVIGVIGGIWGMTKTKPNDVRFFSYLFPIIYLLSVSTALPFTRYILIILPFLYINLVSMIKLII